ncbi:MAG: DUF808 domain-containing protein [Pseudoruegeria sp.]
MSGLLALLDDIAAIAKTAAVQVDDITTQATQVGAKTAGILIDDTAVTPKYVTGLPAARELPIVWKIARGSLFNKLVILLPIAMLLNAFIPFAFVPLLMIGGFYLCFEGAEKIAHSFGNHKSHAKDETAQNPEHLEKQRVAGAIKTDFILSAEIMTIAQSEISSTGFWYEGAILATVAVMITFLVYGSVAFLVKIDDIGIKLCQDGHFQLTRRFGRSLVKAMPVILNTIAIIGTMAMLWVGGSIIVHSLEGFGIHIVADVIHHVADFVGHQISVATGFLEWLVTAALDGILGLAIGLLLIPLVSGIIIPIGKMIGLGAKAQNGTKQK